MENYKVYCHTLPNNKKYIGLTSCKSCSDRWRSGYGYKNQPYFYNAIKKYGWKNIKHEIIAENLTAKQAQALEQKLIAKYDTTNTERGYNISLGGEVGSKLSEEKKKERYIQRTPKIPLIVRSAVFVFIFENQFVALDYFNLDYRCLKVDKKTERLVFVKNPKSRAVVFGDIQIYRDVLYSLYKYLAGDNLKIIWKDFKPKKEYDIIVRDGKFITYKEKMSC